MSTVEHIDTWIYTRIENLMNELEPRKGVIYAIFGGPDPEREHQIIKEIAMLRASLNPSFNGKK